MSRRKILSKRKKKKIVKTPLRNAHAIGHGGGGIKKVGGSFAAGVPAKPKLLAQKKVTPVTKPKAPLSKVKALQASTSLTKPKSPAFKQAVRTVKQAGQPRKKLLKPSNFQAPKPKAPTVKRSGPKR